MFHIGKQIVAIAGEARNCSVVQPIELEGHTSGPRAPWSIGFWQLGSRSICRIRTDFGFNRRLEKVRSRGPHGASLSLPGTEHEICMIDFIQLIDYREMQPRQVGDRLAVQLPRARRLLAMGEPYRGDRTAPASRQSRRDQSPHLRNFSVQDRRGVAPKVHRPCGPPGRHGARRGQGRYRVPRLELSCAAATSGALSDTTWRKRIRG